MSEKRSVPILGVELVYGRAQRGSKWLRRLYVFAWAATLLCVAGFSASLFFGFSRGIPREHTDRLKCASNLKEIGLAIEQYTSAHGDQFPAALTDLPMHPRISVNGVTHSALTPDEFICPATTDTPAKGTTHEAVAADFAQPGHCSYFYVGKGLDAGTATSDVVVAYESPSNHKNRGMNVLFADGHVEFLLAPGVLPWVAAASGGPVIRPGAPVPATMP